MPQGIVIAAALGAAYLATRGKSAPNVRDHRDSDPKAGSVEVVTSNIGAAMANPQADLVSPTGAPASSSYGAVDLDAVIGGDTSKAPSGGMLAGDSSTTPSSGAPSFPVTGTVINLDGSSTPSGPSTTTNPTAPPGPSKVQIPADWVKFGSVDGLTVKQRARALATDGPALGLVW